MKARGLHGIVAVCLLACAHDGAGDGGHEAQGHLAQRLSAIPTTYSYDSLGLRSGGQPTDADSLGRATTHDGATLTWGADGQLAAVTDPSGTRTEMVTDEAGHRLAWRRDGSVFAAEIEGARLTDGHIEEIAKVGGHAVGVLDNGAFTLTSLDLRGSVVGDGEGASAPAGPYGERDDTPAMASVIDYAAAGVDPALGTVVMGVRDYDPATGAFLAPDPKYLEHPDSCLDSPVECSLYGYAHGQPADFVDPTGKEAEQAVTAGAYASDKAGDPTSVGGLCWDHAPEPAKVARENYDWANTAEGRGYSKAYAAASELSLETLASDAFRREADNAEQSWIGACPDCYTGTGNFGRGTLNPKLTQGPGDHVSQDLGLIEGAGPFSSMLMTATFAFSVVGGLRQPDMNMLLRDLTVTKVMDDFVNYMGVSTYGELQNYTIEDLKLHMQLTRTKKY